jgi:hypothetical protein
MSNVHSTPHAYGGAPLPRSWLDSAATPVRVLVGTVFLAWSWYSTLAILGGVLLPLFPSSAIVAEIEDRYLIAAVFAILISVIEFAAAGRWPGAYWLTVLLTDAPFTALQTHTWLAVLLSPHGEISAIGGNALWVVSLIGGVVAAVFGELLLFGKRRR